MTQRKARAHIGTSGYQYDHWSGVFYPEKLPKNQWFKHYAEYFDTVEINNTFYNLPKESTFDDWRLQTPRGFTYVLKFSRYGSHMKCLKDPKDTSGLFIKKASHLGRRLGPILVQLKPNWYVHADRLRSFLDAVPPGRRWAIEFREPSWLCDEVFDILRQHNSALCIHNMIKDHPREVTADWIYLRFHGDHYSGSYSSQFLSAEADRICGYLDEGKDVYAYFNNDAEGHAVRNALDLKRYLGKRGY
ncbi:MAG: DUF72 domain-containing protein [Kiritimatiellia bacterium]